MKNFRLLVGINSFINAIWLFLKIDFSILFLQFTRFKNLLEELDSKTKIVIFCVFNIVLVGIWNDISYQIFEQYDKDKIYVLNMPLAPDSIEYFGSLIVSYIVLIFTIEFIFYRLKNNTKRKELVAPIIDFIISSSSISLSFNL